MGRSRPPPKSKEIKALFASRRGAKATVQKLIDRAPGARAKSRPDSAHRDALVRRRVDPPLRRAGAVRSRLQPARRRRVEACRPRLWRQSEGGVGYLFAVMRQRPARPRFDVDFHRGPTDPVNGRVDAEHVADLDWPDQGHRIDGDRDDAPVRVSAEAMPPATSIWLRTQPRKYPRWRWCRPAWRRPERSARPRLDGNRQSLSAAVTGSTTRLAPRCRPISRVSSDRTPRLARRQRSWRRRPRH